MTRLVVRLTGNDIHLCSSVPQTGLQNAVVLPESSHYDSVLCSHVMDVDWDGQNEIIIGTYGKQILIYKKGMSSIMMEVLTHRLMRDPCFAAPPNSYFIMWQRQFSYPIYRMVHLDINNDGLNELIVTTMYGVHILQVQIMNVTV
jgi:hypothetical protein